MKLLNKLKFSRNKYKALGGNLLIDTKKEKYGVIDAQGNVVYDYKFDKIWTDGDNFLIFGVFDHKELRHKLSILNLKTNEFIVKDTYGYFLTTTWFCDYNIFVIDQGNRTGFLDLSENKKFEYEDIEGVIPSAKYIVKNNGKCGVLVCCFDEKKRKSVIQEILPCENESIKAVYEIREARWDVEEHRMREQSYCNPIYVITNNGKTDLVKFRYAEEMECVASGIDAYKRNGNHHIMIQRGEKFGLIDFDGKTILPCEYDSIENFELDERYNTTANVKKDEKIGCINSKGEIIWPCAFDEIGRFKEGKAKAKFCELEVEIGIDGKSKDLNLVLESAKNPEKAEELKNAIGNLQDYAK